MCDARWPDKVVQIAVGKWHGSKLQPKTTLPNFSWKGIVTEALGGGRGQTIVMCGSNQSELCSVQLLKQCALHPCK